MLNENNPICRSTTGGRKNAALSCRGNGSSWLKKGRRWEKKMHEALIHTIEVYRHWALLYCFSEDFHNFIHRRHFHFSTMLCLQLLSLPEALLIFPFRVSAKRQFSTYEIPPRTISSPVEYGIALVRRWGWVLPDNAWCLSFFFSAFFIFYFVRDLQVDLLA